MLNSTDKVTRTSLEGVVLDGDFKYTTKPSQFKAWEHLQSSYYGSSSDGQTYKMQSIENAVRLLTFYFGDQRVNGDQHFIFHKLSVREKSMKGLSSSVDQKGDQDSQLTANALLLINKHYLYVIKESDNAVSNNLSHPLQEDLTHLERSLKVSLTSDEDLSISSDGKLKQIERYRFENDQDFALGSLFGENNVKYIKETFSQFNFNLFNTEFNTMVTIGLNAEDDKLSINLNDQGKFRKYFAFGQVPILRSTNLSQDGM